MTNQLIPIKVNVYATIPFSAVNGVGFYIQYTNVDLSKSHWMGPYKTINEARIAAKECANDCSLEVVISKVE